MFVLMISILIITLTIISFNKVELFELAVNRRCNSMRDRIACHNFNRLIVIVCYKWTLIVFTVCGSRPLVISLISLLAVLMKIWVSVRIDLIRNSLKMIRSPFLCWRKQVNMRDFFHFRFIYFNTLYRIVLIRNWQKSQLCTYSWKKSPINKKRFK